MACIAYTYDAEGNVLSVDNGGTASYIYDALNQRVQVKTPGSTLEYTYDFAGRRITTWDANANFGVQGQIWWGSQPIAFRSIDNSVYFQQQDWLGTERVRTNYSGSTVNLFTSLPFGDALGQNGTSGTDQNNFHFAQLQHDSGNTDHAQFRQYSNLEGRWMSMDPYAGSYDVNNPQSLNRFSYALNQPLSAIDPYGLYTLPSPPGCGSFWTCSGGFGGICASVGFCSPRGGSGGGGRNAPNKPPLSPQAQACENKIQGAVNNALNISTTYLGPTSGPGMNSEGYRNGAYNFNYFAPGVTNPVAGSTNGGGRFPGSGLHIPLPGGKDPTIQPWGYDSSMGGSDFTAHFDTANPLDDLVSFFEHIINDVLLRHNHGC
jgi:RHS repeat-associated protein